MNRELKEKAQELNDWLLAQPEVKEYKSYEKAIKADDNLASQQEKLVELQKKIVNERNQDNDCDDIIDEYLALRDDFYNNPLVHNYLALKEEVNDLCQQINDIINKEINGE